jgi:flagellar biogenesis protein FliO
MEGIWAALRVVAATGLVVAMAAWTARYLGRRSEVAARGRYLTVVETLSLGQQRGLLAVRAGAQGRMLILGSGREGLVLLAQMDADEFLGPAATAANGVASGTASSSRTDSANQVSSATPAGVPGGSDPLLRMLQGRIGDLRRRFGSPPGPGSEGGYGR